MSAIATDILIIGAGASGLMAGIAASEKNKVIICEKMKKPGLKILASGGERCNVTNTLPHETYMEHFGRQGRFMSHALAKMGNHFLLEFFSSIGIETKCSDGFRYFPATHKAQSVLDGLLQEFEKRGGTLRLEQEIVEMSFSDDHWIVSSKDTVYHSKKLIIATGGLTYPSLGTTGDGYKFASLFGHEITPQHPGGVPLRTKENWTKNCCADTIGKALMYVDLKKHAKISKVGDVIFTPYGVAGPVVLDLSRQITPLLAEYGEVPIVLQLRPQMNQQHWQDFFALAKKKNKEQTILELVKQKLPESIAKSLIEYVEVKCDLTLAQLTEIDKNKVIQILTKTPLTITDSMGYKLAFVTTGGIKLKHIEPETLQSKIQPNLYFCGEVLDLDGPCGGYNLQWAFASGWLAGSSV